MDPKAGADQFASLPEGPRPEALREAFSQACQMYRHYVTMRYYAFALYGVVTAALATLFFTQLPNMEDPKAMGWWIKFCGSIVSVACLAFDWCGTRLMIKYRQEMRKYAQELHLKDFGKTQKEELADNILFIAALLVYLISVIGWLGFARVPTKGQTQVISHGKTVFEASSMCFRHRI